MESRNWLTILMTLSVSSATDAYLALCHERGRVLLRTMQGAEAAMGCQAALMISTLGWS
jgi:hypothetical protein